MTIIHMRTVVGDPNMRALTNPLLCSMRDGTTKMIPFDFKWDGSSVPWIFQGLFPRHRHPVASCRHDYRCGKAENDEDRKFADDEFEIDVRKTSWAVTARAAHAFVRIGAFLGIGSNYK